VIICEIIVHLLVIVQNTVVVSDDNYKQFVYLVNYLRLGFISRLVFLVFPRIIVFHEDTVLLMSVYSRSATF